jgi:hypothetical protein
MAAAAFQAALPFANPPTHIENDALVLVAQAVPPATCDFFTAPLKTRSKASIPLDRQLASSFSLVARRGP